jgi:hypothetical protein
MAEERWYSMAVPILEFVDVRGKEADIVTVGAIAAATGLEPNDVADEVQRLCNAGYLVGPLQMVGGMDARPYFLENSLLGEKGLRVVGAWPSDDPYEALVEILQRQIEETSDPEKKTKLPPSRFPLVTRRPDRGLRASWSQREDHCTVRGNSKAAGSSDARR